ncbi:hypothetical protein LCGC14_2173970 [marine sediment metagenome]|uniref:Uncharacterized protein n=1 Tax=marine sediment metagenome TaxID=412755 RepID=A0A0F9DPA0_9ZZZZ
MSGSDKVQCEIKDTMLSLQRFIAANNKKVIFVGGMLAYDNNGQVKDNTGALFAFGNKNELRNLLNDLRNVVDDNANENDFVNV